MTSAPIPAPINVPPPKDLVGVGIQDVFKTLGFQNAAKQSRWESNQDSWCLEVIAFERHPRKTIPLGLEPRLKEPESFVLPITPRDKFKLAKRISSQPTSPR